MFSGLKGSYYFDRILKQKSFFLNIIFILLILGFANAGQAEMFYQYERDFACRVLKNQVGKPTSIAVDSNGRLLIIFSLANEVRVFESTGQHLFSFGKKSSSKIPLKGNLIEPSGITVDKQNRIYVSDLGTDRIVVYNTDGVFQYEFPVYQPKDGRNPCAPFIAYNPYDNLLYIADACNHVITVYTLEGKFVTDFGSPGSGEDNLSGPANISFDSGGNIYVVDSGNFRVLSFTPDFKFRSGFGQSGTGKGTFVRPYGIALDAKGKIYVSDFILNSVQTFNQKGEYLDSLTKSNDDKAFSQPLGLIYFHHKIYVVNAERKSVSIFNIFK